MIPRYSRPEMARIWEPENRFRIWFEIEAHATDALADLGVVPKEAAAAIWEKGAFEVDRIDAIEAEVKHDVIAFLTTVAEHVGEPARFVHQGLTSSDVLDTCLAVQLSQDGGLTYTTLLSSISTNDVVLTVPDVTTDRARIRISRGSPSASVLRRM